jgi:hypothetical protein
MGTRELYGSDPFVSNPPPLGLALLFFLTPAQPAGAEDLAALDDGQALEMEAERFTLRPKANEVGGVNVRLHTPKILVQADTMNINLDTGVLTLVHPRMVLLQSKLAVKGSHMTISPNAKTLRLQNPTLLPDTAQDTLITGAEGRCSVESCILHSAEGTACPHVPPGYSVHSDKATLHRGGDIDLERPVLYLDGTPVFGLPWVRVRPDNKPGFTFPRLGFDADAGLIIGPGGIIPLKAGTSLEGHAAIRARQGFETRSALKSTNLSFTVDQLYDHPENSARFRLDTTPPISNAELALDVDLVTDNRTIIDDLARMPLERATTHTTSRGLLSRDFLGSVFETSLHFVQPFNVAGGIETSVVSPSYGVGVHLPGTPLARFFWPSFDLTLSRHGTGQRGYTEDAASGFASGHSRVALSPGIEGVFRLGPIHTALQAVTRHQVWMIDNAASHLALHAASWKTDLSLPLCRDYSRFRHVVTPYVRYRLVPWLRGDSPPFVMDDFDSLRQGQDIEAGVSTGASRVTSRFGRFDIFERIALPGFQRSAGPKYLALRGYFGPDVLQAVFDSAVDHQRPSLTLLGFSITSAHRDGSFAEIGGRYMGPGDGPHRNPSFHGGTASWLISPWADEASRQVELFGHTRTPITRMIAFVAGARLGVWPRRVLHAAWYGFELQAPCGCLAGAITASHRLETPVPDIMTSLTILEL